MRSAVKVSLLVGAFAGLLSTFTFLTACRTTGARSGSGLASDEEETRRTIEVLNMIGAQTPHLQGQSFCAGACHAGGSTWHGAIDVDKVKKWGNTARDLDNCFARYDDAKNKLNCMRVNLNDENSAWDHNKLGFYRAGVRTPKIVDIFKAAYGEQWQAQYDPFVAKALMPQPTAERHLTDAEFARLESWVLTGMPKLMNAFGIDASEPVAEAPCQDSTTAEMANHIRAMRTKGWGFKNRSNENIKMLGCPLTVDDDANEMEAPLACFNDNTKWPEVQTKDYARGWAERKLPNGSPLTQRMRILRELKFRSTFWARSSADGRFFASGLAYNPNEDRSDPTPDALLPEDSRGFISDLLDPTRPNIGVSGPYDPGFFPDNKGFTWMGGGAFFCNQKLIEDPATTMVDFDAEADRGVFCGRSNMGVYQHVGASLAGTDYYVVRSDNYSNDDGANSEVRDPSVSPFSSADSFAEIYPMREVGTRFEVGEHHEFKTPFEGDFGISPSATIVTTRIAERVGTRFVQKGYRLRTFDFDAKTTEEVATICMKGGKASMSFNERIMTTHHYTDANDWKELGFSSASDPEFVTLIENSANIYVYDILRSRKVRLTRMKAGQFALYPHFRSDGWLYFLVRDIRNEPAKDYVVATDAAIRIQK